MMNHRKTGEPERTAIADDIGAVFDRQQVNNTPDDQPRRMRNAVSRFRAWLRVPGRRASGADDRDTAAAALSPDRSSSCLDYPTASSPQAC